MKRKILIFMLLVGGFCGKARAYDYWSLVKDKTVMSVSSWTFTSGITSTTTILVDLSSTTVYPHKVSSGSPRQLNVSGIRVELDKVSASSCAVALGVVNFVDASSGSVTWFWRKSVLNNELNMGILDSMTGEYFIKLRVDPLVPISQTEGLTPFLISNSRLNGSTIYQTDVLLPSVAGSGFPGVGDIVMQVDKVTTSTITVNVQLMYHAE